MRNTYKGRYQIKNPYKYRGDPTKVIYRSSWELKVFNYMDRTDDIVQWSSEEIVIPYKSPIDGRWHRYFPDLWVKTKTNEVFLIEIKPYNQTREPKKRSRITKQYLNEVKTWGINSAKWEAAREFCEDRKWKFKIFTEKELGL